MDNQGADLEDESDSESVQLIRDSLKAAKLAETSFDKLLNNVASAAALQNAEQVCNILIVEQTFLIT